MLMSWVDSGRFVELARSFEQRVRPGYGEGRSVREVKHARFSVDLCVTLWSMLIWDGHRDLTNGLVVAQAKMHIPRKTQAMEAGPGEFSFKRWRMERHL